MWLACFWETRILVVARRSVGVDVAKCFTRSGASGAAGESPESPGSPASQAYRMFLNLSRIMTRTEARYSDSGQETFQHRVAQD